MSSNQRDFARDNSSRALINKNKEAFLQYKRAKHKDQKLQKLEEEVSEIKQMLQQLLDKE